MKSIFKNIEEAPVDSLNLRWDQLELSESLLNVIKKEFKFKQMTPVQAASIPLMLKNKDVIVEAKTGSGKTLAFLIPIIESLMRLDKQKPIDPKDTLAIVLSPTIELASQIHQELRKLVRNPLLKDERRLFSQLIVGKSKVSQDLHKYAKYGANIIVATPGKLSTIMEMTDNNLSCCIRKNLAFLIFDEADQMLSIGFERYLSTILAYLPKQRRTSLFSATQTSEVEDLIKTGLRNPIRVNVNRLDDTMARRALDSDLNKRLEMPERLLNYYHVCETYAKKLGTLAEILRSGRYKKVLVFVSTRFQIHYFSRCLEEELGNKKVPILKLHSHLNHKRKSIFKTFKSSKRCILLCTDILSRGIDVPDISCVIHLDLPTSPECYVHRSGRSGHQINLKGLSLLMIEPHELDYVEMCRRRQIQLAEMDLKLIGNESALSKSSQRMVEWMKALSAKDESYQTLGIQAYVSYIRFYSSKMCLKELLFPKLPVGHLARSFGLLRLPKMPELKKSYKSIVCEFKGVIVAPKEGSGKDESESDDSSGTADTC